MNRKYLAILTALVALVCGLTACGDTSSSQASSSAQSQVVETPSDPIDESSSGAAAETAPPTPVADSFTPITGVSDQDLRESGFDSGNDDYLSGCDRLSDPGMWAYGYSNVAAHTIETEERPTLGVHLDNILSGNVGCFDRLVLSLSMPPVPAGEWNGTATIDLTDGDNFYRDHGRYYLNLKMYADVSPAMQKSMTFDLPCLKGLRFVDQKNGLVTFEVTVADDGDYKPANRVDVLTVNGHEYLVIDFTIPQAGS